MFSGLSGSDLLVIFVSIVISMGIHEATHAYVAHWLGDTTAADMGRLTLNPLKHIDIVTTVLLPVIMIATIGQPFFAAKPVPFNPDRVKYDEYGAALIGISGPFINLFLAILAALIFRGWATHLSFTAGHDLILFIQVNIAFFVFNMIPFPPLDGSRLLYAFAPEGLQRVMFQIESMGFLAILVFFLLVFQIIAGPIISIENSLLRILLGG